MSDTDPPHEVDDGEAPTDGDVNAPDADASQKQVAERVQQHHGRQEAHSEAHHPSHRRGTGQHDRADLVGYGREGMPGLDDRRPLVRYFDLVQMVWHLVTCSPLTLPAQGW